MKRIDLSANIPDETVDSELKEAVQKLIQEKYKGAVLGVYVSKPQVKGAGLKIGDL